MADFWSQLKSNPSASLVRENIDQLCNGGYMDYNIFDDEDLVIKLFSEVPDICSHISYSKLRKSGLLNFVKHMNVNNVDVCGNYIMVALVVGMCVDGINLCLSRGFDICKCPYLLYYKRWPSNILSTVVSSDIISGATKYQQQDTFLVFGDNCVTKIKQLNSAVSSFLETMNIIKLLDLGINNVVKVGTNTGNLCDVIRDKESNKLYLCLTIDRYDDELKLGDGINGEWLNIWTQCYEFLKKLHTNGIVHADVKMANILKRKLKNGLMEYMVSDYEAFVANNLLCSCDSLPQALNDWYKLLMGSYVTYYQSPINDIGCLLISVIETITDISYNDIVYSRAAQFLDVIDPNSSSYGYKDFKKHPLFSDVQSPIQICIYIALELVRDTHIMLNEHIPVELKVLHHNNAPDQSDLLRKNLTPAMINNKDHYEFVKKVYEEVYGDYVLALAKLGI
jgi:hypothetical protein